jgi:hypothetical protein
MQLMRWFVALLLAGFASLAAAADAVATVTHLMGTLSATRADGSKVLLSVKSRVAEGDTLATVQDTYARIRFNDGSEVVLRPNSVFKVDRFNYEEATPKNDSFLVNLIKGGMRAVSGLLAKRSRDRVMYETNYATIGIRGTHFGVLICKADCADIPTVSGLPLIDGMHVDVVEGAISLKNEAGELVVGEGEFAYVKDRDTEPRLVPPSDGVRVTMPASISQNFSDGWALDIDKTDSQCTVK